MVSGRCSASLLDILGTSWGLKVSGSGAKIINACHPLPTLEKLRRPTVDGTTNTHLKTHASGETVSGCVVSVSGIGLACMTQSGARLLSTKPGCVTISERGWRPAEPTGSRTNPAPSAGLGIVLRLTTSTRRRRTRSLKGGRRAQAACGHGRHSAGRRS